MSVISKIKNSSKNTKLIAIALVMAVVAGGITFASSRHTFKRAAVKNAQKAAPMMRTVTTKDGKKIKVPVPTQDPAQRAKLNEVRLQKRIDSAVKQKRLTAAQAKLIKDKYASLTNVKATDIKARSEAQKDLYTWAKDNKIPLSFVFELSRPRA